MLLYQWLAQATSKDGGAKALVYRDTYQSWRGLQHRVDRRAQELTSMGIGKGHWVGLMLGNVPDFAILALAISKVEATVVPMDPTTGARDLALLLDLAPLRALITRPRGGVDSIPPSPSNRPLVLEARRRLQGTLLSCTIYKRRVDAAPPAEIVLFTTDSTGEPKGVLRSTENVEAGCEQLRTTLDITSDDKVLTTAPLYHAYGFDLGFAAPLREGATIYVEDDLSPRRVSRILREQEIDLLPGTPQLYDGLATLPTAKAVTAKGARFLSSGSALPASVAEGFLANWGVKVLATYHTTETHTVSVDRKGQHPESVGKTADGVQVKIGDGGTMWVRSPAVSRQSITLLSAGKRNGTPIGSLDKEGWYHTGDLGKIDRAGRLYLTGREDDVVKVDGKRVALGEVDACLETYPRVKAAQSRLVQDPLVGPMVVARVLVVGKCNAEDIIEHCAHHLASYKVPRRIEFSDRLL